MIIEEKREGCPGTCTLCSTPHWQLQTTISQLTQERDALKSAIRYEGEKAYLSWSDRGGLYHPTEFWQAVLYCSLDHGYDRTSDGIPYEMPEEFAQVFRPIVARHLSAVEPDWVNKTVYMDNAQRLGFESELHAANEAALAHAQEKP